MPAESGRDARDIAEAIVRKLTGSLTFPRWVMRAAPGSFSQPLHREGEVVLEEANYSGEQIKKALDLIYDAAARTNFGAMS
jgi:hypothetical protein